MGKVCWVYSRQGAYKDEPATWVVLVREGEGWPADVKKDGYIQAGVIELKQGEEWDLAMFPKGALPITPIPEGLDLPELLKPSLLQVDTPARQEPPTAAQQRIPQVPVVEKAVPVKKSEAPAAAKAEPPKPAVPRQLRYFDKERPVYLYTEGIAHERRVGNSYERYRIAALSYSGDGANLPSWKGADWYLLGVIHPWSEPNMVMLMPGEPTVEVMYAEARSQLAAKGLFIFEDWLGSSTRQGDGHDARRFITIGVTPIRRPADPAAPPAAADQDVAATVAAIYAKIKKK